MSKPFRFRQFELKQEKAAHKLGTDSLVLGAWAGREEAMNILDIGTGTGVLALMMAQKHPEALVDALEPDELSAEEADQNFEASPWAYRLTCYRQRLQDFAREETLHYDLIISNPPYFDPIVTDKGNNGQWPQKRRKDARTTEALSFTELLEGVGRLLVSYGSFFVVLPLEQEASFLMLAGEHHFFLAKRLLLSHQYGQNPVRVLLEWKKTETTVTVEETLAIWEKEGVRTKEYLSLTADFHLFS